MNFFSFTFIVMITMMVTACQSPSASPDNTQTDSSMVKLITLDPGHFHAALVQKSMYPGVDSTVNVYAPAGPDLQLHLARINGYNKRAEQPTNWNEEVYTGADFFEKMLQEKKGNIVVLAGNNQKKTEYIKRCIDEGLNILADKPMVIDQKNFETLKNAFDAAASKKLLLYDIMTERYEITNALQRELSMLPEIFGQLEKGTAQDPAVTKESIHHFYKYVSGNVLTRPAWFMDVSQQGEGLVDVTTHLVDLVQWASFPEQKIDYRTDIKLLSARRWSTDMTLSQFNSITKLNGFPAYLQKDVVNDSVLKVFSNGEIHYQIKGIHSKVSVIWNYQSPEGAGDTHNSMMRGTLANLVIRQKNQDKRPVLYIEPVKKSTAEYESIALEKLKIVQQKYPGIELKKNDKGWEVMIPDKYNEGHEAHFARVTEKLLEFLKKGELPGWEVPNMITKYYITTGALELARSGKGAK
ncbi:MAG: Gfo/Idh/MocA family oxidoreductase [Chitinophagaceae bacterium]|nr:Gfo/Idh/MocA family oxidoreductase [Chitinophagaceae bacterium]